MWWGGQRKRLCRKTSEKTSEKILTEIRNNRNVTIAELSELVGVTTRSVERNLKRLQESGLLERIGPAKGGHWVVRKEP
jgi:predicted HTH transcriptional regulator